MKKELGCKIRKSMEKCWGTPAMEKSAEDLGMQKSEDKPIDNTAKEFLKEFADSKLLKSKSLRKSIVKKLKRK